LHPPALEGPVVAEGNVEFGDAETLGDRTQSEQGEAHICLGEFLSTVRAVSLKIVMDETR
jgi:hypothetical protein